MASNSSNSNNNNNNNTNNNNNNSGSSSSVGVVDCLLDRKYFGALVNGLIKKNYYNDNTITQEFLLQSIFNINTTDISSPTSPDNNKTTSISVASQIVFCIEESLSIASYNNYTPDQLIEYLNANNNNNNNNFPLNLTSEQIEVYSGIWRKETVRIHNSVVNNTSYNCNKIHNLKWRIDLQSNNNAQAILQLTTNNSNGNSSNNNNRTIQFELTKPNVNEVMNQLNIIQQIIQTRT